MRIERIDDGKFGSPFLVLLDGERELFHYFGGTLASNAMILTAKDFYAGKRVKVRVSTHPLGNGTCYRATPMWDTLR